uniref:Transmembrane protein 47 n=1 Tax=Globodera rostochiensis TaxID=31243 RepID=A0A914H4B0_GLORO
MPVQTTTIETVTVVRPLKVISLVCLCLSLVLLVIALCTTSWLKTYSFHTGLFQECTDRSIGALSNPVPNAAPEGECQPPARNRFFVRAAALLLIGAAAFTLFAIFVNIAGLRSNDLHRKYVFYKAATWLSLVSVLAELVALVGFPICFYLSIHSYGLRNWEFDWSYGIAWGSLLFAFGALLLLICDKEHEEVYYREKTIYNPPIEFA